MNVVEPIRDKEQLADVLSYLKDWNERNYIMVMIGIYTAFRISDILKLRVRDVDGDYITIREEKRDAYNRIVIHPRLKRALRPYIKDKAGTDFLIKSRKGHNRPIGRQQAYRIIREACEACGITGSVGTHTLRKTFGYHHYQSNKDIAILQSLLNHNDEAYTLRYIGINQDSKDDAIKSFDFF